MTVELRIGHITLQNPNAGSKTHDLFESRTVSLLVWVVIMLTIRFSLLYFYSHVSEF